MSVCVCAFHLHVHVQYMHLGGFDSMGYGEISTGHGGKPNFLLLVSYTKNTRLFAWYVFPKFVVITFAEVFRELSVYSVKLTQVVCYSPVHVCVFVCVCVCVCFAVLICLITSSSPSGERCKI